jgi:hypothetical protein
LVFKGSKKLEIGHFYNAYITEADNFDLYGEIKD